MWLIQPHYGASLWNGAIFIRQALGGMLQFQTAVAPFTNMV